MKTTIIQMVPRMRGVLCFLAALLFVMGATRQTSAQVTVGDIKNAWSGFNSNFVYLEPDNYSKIFRQKQGNNTPEGFWTQAEEIEMAEDAYEWAVTNDSANLTSYKNEVESLCDGFVNDVAKSDDWSFDNYNDDLDVAIIAFARAYNITGTGRWKTDAQNNYSTVWYRAQAGDGGLCQNVTKGCYENSSVNWTFVIAANLLNGIDPNGTGYKSQGDGVFTWAKANLYNSTTGEIYDAKGGVHGQYTYNYGYAMIAGSYQGSNVMVPKIATYVFNNLTNYDGTVGGYNLMPDYGQGDGNNSGFNGILMRGVGFANGYGYIPSAVLAAAQANMNQAWAVRVYPGYISWNDWSDSPPSGTTLYSWDCSAAMSGLFDIPNP